MTNNTNFIDLTGTQLESKWVGEQTDINDRVILFLHEGLGCISMWRDFPEALSSQTGLRSFIYSRQGYGKSDPVKLPRNVNFMKDEALEILPKLLDLEGINRVILVGHSDGGSIALINAGGTRDPRIEAIVCLAAHVFNEDITIKHIQEAKKEFETGDLREKLAKHHGSNVDCAFWGWNDIWLNSEFKKWNIEDFLPNINVPALVIQGEEDQYGTMSQVDAIRAGIGGNATIEIIPDCGHSPHIERRDITLKIITQFINTLPAF